MQSPCLDSLNGLSCSEGFDLWEGNTRNHSASNESSNVSMDYLRKMVMEKPLVLLVLYLVASFHLLVASFSLIGKQGYVIGSIQYATIRDFTSGHREQLQGSYDKFETNLQHS
ncbi:uncharacterized protein [Henckelia pumila]|uniref:uncharacterized protein n=1 Tax=Henckelia pumila TaxID=405737 RepID=UPI003C6E08F0